MKKKNQVNKRVISAENPIAELVETEQHTQKEEQISKVPTNEEVMQAVKTLQAAGIAVTFQPGQLQQMNTAINPELAQLQMLTGGNSQQNNGLDMLPYMLMQSQNNPQYNPQMVQAMMMNYMMPNLSSDKND